MLIAIKTLMITMLVVTIGLAIVLKPDFIWEMVKIVIELPSPSREIVALTPAQKTLPLQPEQRRPRQSLQSPALAQMELESPVTAEVAEKPGK